MPSFLENQGKRAIERRHVPRAEEQIYGKTLFNTNTKDERAEKPITYAVSSSDGQTQWKKLDTFEGVK